MPALVDIRRRIRSVKNTQQITKAMKMVSAAKLRRAQDAMFAARPYARKMMEVLSGVAARAEAAAHPLLEERVGERILLVVVTADKGLCGGFNANIIRTAVRFLEDKRPDAVELELLGRKGRDYFRRRQYRVRSEQVGLFQALRYDAAQTIAQRPHEGLHRPRGGPGLPDLQRVQERHPAEDRRGAAPAHRARAGLAQGPRARVPVRARAGEDLRRAASQARRGAGVARAPGVGGGRTRRAHGRHGRRHPQRGRT